MMNTIALWVISFIGALSLAFALKTPLVAAFMIYSAIFSVCVATVVIHFV